jgi:hypothetical protein
MKNLLCAAGAALLLAACAAPTATPADAEAHAACRNTDPPIGSHLVRRSDCSTTSAQDREGAQRDAQMLQQQQTLRQGAPRN